MVAALAHFVWFHFRLDFMNAPWIEHKGDNQPVLSVLGHKFGDVFWKSGSQRTGGVIFEFCDQLLQFDACELPFEWLGDLLIVGLEFQESLGDEIGRASCRERV